MILKTTIVVCEINKLLCNECIFLMVLNIHSASLWLGKHKVNSDSERRSSGLVALRCAFPQLQHDGIAVRHAQYLTASGRVWGWWHWRVPSYNYKMAASRCAITFQRKSGRVQEELNMIHYPRAAACFFLPVCGRKSQVTSSRHIAVCLVAKALMKLLYICTCVFFDLWYFRIRASLRMWQEI